MAGPSQGSEPQPRAKEHALYDDEIVADEKTNGITRWRERERLVVSIDVRMVERESVNRGR